MNDFTKKELIALEDAMDYMLALHTPQDGKSPLLEKLQTMIDNYCDHEFHGDFHVCVDKCKNCGVIEQP